MKKSYIVLPLLLFASTYNISQNTLNNPTGIKKLLPSENSDYRSKVCLGMLTSKEAGLPEIYDEFVFDQKDNGKISLAYGRSIVVPPKLVFTIGIKLTSKTTASYINQAQSFDFQAIYSPNGASLVHLSHQETATVTNSFKHSNISTYIKELGYYSNQVYLTLVFPTQGLITSLNFTFGKTTATYERVQVYSGGLSDFQGFVQERYAPCHITKDNAISNRNLNINVQIDSTFDIVSALYTSSFGYDEEDDEYIIPAIHENKITTDRVLGAEESLTLSVKDKTGNTNYLTYIVHYIDSVFPQIRRKSLSENITFEYQLLTADNLISKYIISDNYELTNVSIEGLDFTTAKKKVGTYPFIVKARDSSGNETIFEDEVVVIDRTKPVIDGPTTINLTVTKGMTEEKLLELFTATDEIDDNVQLTVVKNDYSRNASKKGTYDFSLKATDASGNTVDKKVYIKVTDDKEPIFIVNRGTITTYVGQLVDIMETVNSLKLQKLIPDANYIGYTVVDGVDPSKIQLPIGSHYVKILVNTDQGKSEMIDLIINVEDNLEDSIITNQTKNGFFDTIAIFFQKLFNSIADFFENLF